VLPVPHRGVPDAHRPVRDATEKTKKPASLKAGFLCNGAVESARQPL